MITRINHCAVRAKDMEVTAKFYREVLGMPEAFRMHSGPGGSLAMIHMYVAPSQYIEISTGGTALGMEDPGAIGVFHMCYEVDDAQAYMEEIRARGAVIDKEIRRGFTRAIQFWTHDPDGNPIEFVQITPDSMQAEANRKYAQDCPQ